MKIIINPRRASSTPCLLEYREQRKLLPQRRFLYIMGATVSLNLSTKAHGELSSVRSDAPNRSIKLEIDSRFV